MAREDIAVGASARQGLTVQASISSGPARHGSDMVATALASPIQPAELRVAWGYGRGHDQDRDGIPDRRDRDRDGDGIPNRWDPNPNRPNLPVFPRPRGDRPCYVWERPDFWVRGYPRCWR